MPCPRCPAGDNAVCDQSCRCPGPTPSRHRRAPGASHRFPEHTPAAYRAALEAGVDGLECGVRLTADHEIVLSHDSRIDRTSSGSGWLATHTLEELRTLDWGSWHRGPDSAESDGEREVDEAARGILTLDEWIDLAEDAGRSLGLFIETKHPVRTGGAVERALADRLVDRNVIDASADAGARPWVRVMSFSRTALARMHELVPDIGLVLLVEARLPRPTPRRLPRGVTTIGLDIEIVRTRPELVAVHHDQGHEVYVWTVDDPDDLRRCRDLGVDAVATNRPAVALDQMTKCR